MAQGGTEAAPQVTDTIVAIATPPGEGAIGLVRLSGSKALACARAFVRPGVEPEPRRAVLARALDGGRLLDTVVMTWYPAGASYTGEESVELAAHGSPYVLRRLVELSVQAGARPAEPGEYTLRAFLNGRLDLAQAEAVSQLIRSRTSSAQRAAAEALEGGTSRAVSRIREAAVELLARLEVAIDHSDDDHPAVSPSDARLRLAPVEAALERLLASARSGRLLAEGLKVAIVGAPNVGKSSLLNALLGKDRAIVLDQPGTTRDTLEEAADVGGLACILVDTAGLRSGALDPAEALGIERTRRALERADACLVVLDASRSLGPEDAEVLRLSEGRPRVIVLNKSDLPRVLSEPGVPVSALREEGLAGLAAALRNAAGLPSGEEGSAAATVRQLHALEEARAALVSAAGVLDAGLPDFAETAAHHLRLALKPLDAVVGREAAEDVIAAVFSRFCIGK